LILIGIQTPSNISKTYLYTRDITPITAVFLTLDTKKLIGLEISK